VPAAHLEDRNPLQSGVQQNAVEIFHEKQVAAPPKHHPAPVGKGVAGKKVKDFIFGGKPRVSLGRGGHPEGRQGCERLIFPDFHGFGRRTFPDASCARGSERRSAAKACAPPV
jgi:hypothetical protein